MAQPFGLIFELDETHSISFLSRKATKLGGDSENTVKTEGWHEKDPSLLKRFAGNGEISI